MSSIGARILRRRASVSNVSLSPSFNIAKLMQPRRYQATKARLISASGLLDSRSSSFLLGFFKQSQSPNVVPTQDIPKVMMEKIGFV